MCQPLTVGNLGSYLPYGTAGFVLDNEGMAVPPLCLLQISPDPTTGTFTAVITNALPPAPSSMEIPASGTLTPVGTNGLGISFTFSTEPPLTIYNYSGAMAVQNEECQILLAGTYTQTTYVERRWPKGIIIIPITNGPYPFSAQVEFYIAE